MAFYSFKFKPGDKILASMADYGSNVIAYLQQSKKMGVEVVYIPNDKHGQLDTQALFAAIDDRVKLISITHVPSGGGLVNPAAAIGKIAKQANIPYLLDSCQDVGQLHIDVEAIGCDMLCATGRKYLRGPRGTGFLYVRKILIEKLEPPFLDQHSAELTSPDEYIVRTDAKRFETWEQNYAGKAALGTAIDYALSWGLPAIQKRVSLLANTLRNKLSEIKGITVTDEGSEKCGIVTFMSSDMDAYEIKSKLLSNKINVSISDGAGSLISFHDRNLSAVIRPSVHYYNTDEEIDVFINILNKIIKTN
jgi:selenocysteine lyase/cysteine desulfurase